MLGFTGMAMRLQYTLRMRAEKWKSRRYIVVGLSIIQIANASCSIYPLASIKF
jgi:hypothetical protein